MGERLQEIRTLWSREDLTQPISLGKAFDAIEWCLGEIERLRSGGQFAADALVFGAKHTGAEMDEMRDGFRRWRERCIEARSERDAAFKREGRLREALERIANYRDPLLETAKSGRNEAVMNRALKYFDVVTIAREALADEGRE